MHLRNSLGVFLLGLALSSACGFVNPTEPTEPPLSPSVVNYTAIGASDATGFGSSSFCLPFMPCPNGKGYVQLLHNRLKSDGRTVTLLNLGLPGAVLGPEIQSLGNQLGRDILSNFLDNEVPFVGTDSTLVTVFAGGNDVNTVGAAVEAGLGGADPLGYVQARTAGFARDLAAMVDGIKGRAPQARVVVLNLPNLAGLPYAAGYSSAKKKALQDIAVRFSAEVNKLAAKGAIVVDIMCDGGFYQSNMYSGDGFHPNDAGYARMAEVAYPAASTGANAPPKASCSYMKLY